MENRGKNILLLCLVVTAVTTAIYTSRSNPGGHYSSPRLAAQTEASRVDAARRTLNSEEAPVARPKPEPAAVVTPLHRNPFSRPAGAPSAAPAPPKQPEANQKQAEETLPVAAVPAAVPKMQMPPPASPAAVPPLAVQSQAVGVAGTLSAAPAAPSLSGVVGDRSGYQTAVIRFGDRRYFARQGDKIAGKYQVQSVSDRQVVLVGADGKLTLRMGGME